MLGCLWGEYMSLVCEYKKNQKAVREAGFTLIEVAIALVVIGVLAVPFIQQYNLYKIDKITSESRGNLYVVKAALQKYALNYGRYPTPSAKNIVSGDIGYGEETTLTFGALPLCATDNTGVCRTTAVDNTAVLIGTVPFSTIGLPEQYTLDGYKRRFTYAITKSLTETTSFTDNGGKITLLDRTGGAHTNTNIPGNVQFVVVSHGLNGKGAYTSGGVRPFACTGLGNDIQNCNDDDTFNSNFDLVGNPPEYKRLEFSIAGANQYDDYIEFATSTTSDIWTKNANAASQDIYNRSSNDKVRIGSWGGGLLAGETFPKAKVDVAGDSTSAGNVKANRILTSRLCTFAEDAGVESYVGCVPGGGTGFPEQGVFTPSIIGGDVDPGNTKAETAGNGINCGDKALKGIREANEICSNYIPPGTFGVDASSCVTGTGGIKFVGGVLYCGNL